MAKVFIEETTLTAIGDAIRSKTGKTDLIDPAVMSTEIESIETGGGEFPEEALNISGNCTYRFSYNAWNWLLDTYGNRMTTKDITNLNFMFAYSNQLEAIPFVLNVKDCEVFCSAFNSVRLTECPKVRGTIKIGNATNLDSMVSQTHYLRNAEDLFEPEMLEGWKDYKWTGSYSGPKVCNFYNCYSLRSIPSWWYKFKLNPESTAFPYTSYTPYYTLCNSCYALDEILNIPVWKCQGAQTGNMLYNTVAYTFRLKDFTFETDNGQPIEVQWKAQTIDFTNGGTGYATTYAYVTKYNSGITSDKEVKDDATYQTLKNDPDWFTSKLEYSRYNHDSAVATINSLPDTSAYLAANGGTNTIKFKGAAGSATDGGAINTLTEEEIAVATAKGWTVTLV